MAAVVMAVRAPDASQATTAPALGAVPGASGKQLDDVDTMIGKLEDRLKREPKDGEGFRMLGWSYMMTNRPEKALEPYKRALELLPNSALVHSGYGEALAGIAKGTVTPEARAEFEKALAIDPAEPRAKYFLALWQAQNGQPKEALEKWIALANSGPADAPWQTDLRAKITEVSGKLGVDVTARLKNVAPIGDAKVSGSAPQLDPGTVQAASALPDAQRSAMVDSMVSGLAEKLKANPADADRWVLLLRSRMVLKQADMARADLVTARRALAKDASGLSKVNVAAKDLGVPGA
ncbi:hypothetical protein [Novosphingobium aquae]|uniref:Cytochrome c-type biogenesis protein H TPR domain-containing protein n=1 Tax=Novosphingobium aquae TaxID=3133435 RepID=A0ABU8SDI7_9SPHN